MNFEAVPLRDAQASTSTSAPDWTVLFAEAALAPAAWTAAEPRLNPPVYADTRVAWQGSLAGEPDLPLRVEAAGYKGRAVSFEIIGPWTPATPAGSLRSGASGGLAAFGIPAFVIMLSILVASALFFARRNLRLGRGDRRGATRLMLFVLASWTLAWLCIEHHVAGAGEALLFAAYAGTFLPVVGVFWVLYIAVEPFVRRRWPGILVSWSRLLAGDWRDPRLGRDVLIGCAAGVCTACLRLLATLVSSWSADVPPPVMTADWNMLDRTASFAGAVFGQFSSSFVVTLGSLVGLFLLRVVLRRDWAAAAVFALVAGTAILPPTLSPNVAFVLLAVVNGVLSLFVLMRVGLVASTLAGFLTTLFLTSPLTAQTSAWYASLGYAIVVLTVAMSLYGFKVSLGGRPILTASVADD
jgi:serine/threonine-protein kinase